MMVDQGRAVRMKANAASTAALVVQLLQDKKFRERLLSALEHSAKAGRLMKQNLGLLGAVARLATDQALLKELQSARSDLVQIGGQVKKKRTGHQVRRLIVFGSLISLAAIPQLRNRLIQVIREGFRLSSSISDRVSQERQQLEEMTRDELYARAQEADVPGRSEMSKDQLVEALRLRS